MAVSLQALKIGAEKVEQIQDTLKALDEATALISAFTQTEENQALLSKLLENIDDVKTIVSSVDLMETTTEDINKGTFLGNRKIDIDVALNKTGIAEALNADDVMAIWNNTENTVYYDKAICTFVDGTVINVNFVNDDSQAITVSTHGDIIAQLNKHTAFTTKLENTSIAEDVGGRSGTLIRITDITGTSSNLERVELNAVTGASVNTSPIYYWAQTTSALQTLANRVGDIIALGNDIDSIIVLSDRIDEMLALQSKLTELQALYDNLAEILTVDDNKDIAIAKANEASASATLASQQVTLAQAQVTLASEQVSLAGDKVTLAQNEADRATAQADIATAKSDEIKGITAQAVTGASGTSAAAVYNPVDGKFTFTIPQGEQGIRGEAFSVDAIGNLTDRTNYDAQPTNFSFLAVDTGELYFKKSSTSGDWSAAIPFGKGDTGATGATGNGIASIVRTTGDGSAGTTDTYTITFTDETTSAFNVYNGADGVDSAVLSVAGKTGDIVLTQSDINGLDSEINTKAVAMAIALS